MSSAAYWIGILVSAFTLGLVVELLRRRSLKERHAVWWLFAGVLALIVSVFPSVLEWVSTLLGIEVPSNLTFFVSTIVLFFVNLQHSTELTQLENKTRRLAEEVALLHEQQIKHDSND